MKKILLKLNLLVVAVLACVSLAACQQDDVIDITPTQTADIVGTWTASGTTSDGKAIATEMTFKADKSYTLTTQTESERKVEKGVYRMDSDYLYLTPSNGSNKGVERSLKYELKDDNLTVYDNSQGALKPMNFTRQSGEVTPGTQTDGLPGTWVASYKDEDGILCNYALTLTPDKRYIMVMSENNGSADDAWRQVETGLYRVGGDNLYLTTIEGGSEAGSEQVMKYELQGDKLALSSTDDEGKAHTLQFTRKAAYSKPDARLVGSWKGVNSYDGTESYVFNLYDDNTYSLITDTPSGKSFEIGTYNASGNKISMQPVFSTNGRHDSAEEAGDMKYELNGDKLTLTERFTDGEVAVIRFNRQANAAKPDPNLIGTWSGSAKNSDGQRFNVEYTFNANNTLTIVNQWGSNKEYITGVFTQNGNTLNVITSNGSSSCETGSMKIAVSGNTMTLTATDSSHESTTMQLTKRN